MDLNHGEYLDRVAGVWLSRMKAGACGGDPDDFCEIVREMSSEFVDKLSPIEMMMGTALSFMVENHPALPGRFYRHERATVNDMANVARFAGMKAGWFVFPQVRARLYRLDFAIWYSGAAGSNPIVSAIECDGHLSHVRNRKMAAHDRRRDRWLQAAGVPVFRFTGSEIVKHPIDCASQALGDTHLAWAARNPGLKVH